MKKTLLFTASILSLMLLSCGKKSSGKVAVYNGIAPEMAMEEALYDMDDSIAVSSKKAVARSSDVSANGAFEPAPAEYEAERKLIKTGYATINVPSFENIELNVQNYAKLYGGYITNTFLSETNYSAEIKVPCTRFEEAMNNVGALGDVKSRSQNASDVTDEYYDLESRINSKKILKEKLEGYLKKADSIKDLMEIERQLNSVVSDLEAMEGRMKRLSKQIDYSTISIQAYLPAGFTDTGYDWPDLGEDFKEIGYNIVNFLAGLFIFAIYLVLYGVPILALCAFLFWLLFGKVGLLRKLFGKLKK